MDTLVKRSLKDAVYTFRDKLIVDHPINNDTDKDIEALLIAVDDKLREIEDLVSNWEDIK